MIRWIFLVASIICAQGVSAQATEDSLRAFYIKEFPDRFHVWPVLKYRSLAFEIRDRDTAKNSISFRPNNAATLGLGFYLFEVVFEVTFAVPLGEQQQKIYGKTDARDFQANILTKSWGVDLYNQKYSGFYKDDARTTIPSGTPYPHRPDIYTRNYGISGFYVLNNKKFSLRSSYNYADRQIRSKGSFIVYGTINAFRASADSAMVSANERVGFGKGSDFEDIRSTTLSIAPGYSYNLVVKKFFLNGTIIAGPAHDWVYYKTADNKEKYDVSFNGTYSLRLAMGYSSNRIFGGIGVVMQARVVKFQDVRFENMSNTVRVLIGYRFQEKGILKKRIWEFLPRL